jgi:hypothetical protein
MERLQPSGIRRSANSAMRLCSWLSAGSAVDLVVRPKVTMNTSLPTTAMWYFQASRISATTTGRAAPTRRVRRAPAGPGRRRNPLVTSPRVTGVVLTVAS